MKLRWVATLIVGLWACGTEVNQANVADETVMYEESGAIATLCLEVTFTEAPDTRGFYSHALELPAAKRRLACLIDSHRAEGLGESSAGPQRDDIIIWHEACRWERWRS